MAQETSEKDKLSCREAQLILQATPIDTDGKEMNQIQFAAATHYSNCRDCLKIGLAKIVGKELSCKEALLASVADGFSATIKGRLAQEHIAGNFYAHISSCIEKPCCLYRNSGVFAPGDANSIDNYTEFPILILVFSQMGWPLEEIFQKQNKWFSATQSIRQAEKFWANIKALQETLLRLQEQQGKGFAEKYHAITQ